MAAGEWLLSSVLPFKRHPEPNERSTEPSVLYRVTIQSVVVSFGESDRILLPTTTIFPSACIMLTAAIASPLKPSCSVRTPVVLKVLSSLAKDLAFSTDGAATELKGPELGLHSDGRCDNGCKGHDCRDRNTEGSR